MASLKHADITGAHKVFNISILETQKNKKKKLLAAQTKNGKEKSTFV